MQALNLLCTIFFWRGSPVVGLDICQQLKEELKDRILPIGDHLGSEWWNAAMLSAEHKALACELAQVAASRLRATGLPYFEWRRQFYVAVYGEATSSDTAEFL